MQNPSKKGGGGRPKNVKRGISNKQQEANTDESVVINVWGYINHDGHDYIN